MENLTISDAPPPGARGHAQGPPQLPPQMFTTAAQLLDLTDTNLVLQSTTERIFALKPGTDPSAPEGYYADVAHGIFLIRGENVLLLGEIDLDKDDDPPPNFEPADVELVKKLAEEKKAHDKAKDKKRLQKLATMGFEGENLGEVVF
ncbi:hypothetical protein MHUMG1_02447 [Metarhizium humberi]|uniref:Uncharacterized protein n=2 Tax=Metarhizium TaxID=5529 RepID=A0A9P8SA28_9HYPO